MPPPPHQKPENVLKRAHELIGVNQSSAALTLLHEHITSKRSRNVPIALLEPVMLLLVELSVDQKKGKVAKDALYQYKNISQNTNVATIELVLKKFIDLSVVKASSAQQKADEVQTSIEAAAAAPTTSVDDLEAIETPESLLLATVSGEQSRDRTDRAIVTPWLKFLWEAYRTVLDILRNNARLELLYQATAMQAFNFCLKYARKTEFRRLCELLRNHVQTAAKYSSQMHAINLNDPETLQRHLETRFQQLNVAVELELWQEAFRSVEDIHTLLNLSKRPPKNLMMGNYYEKLTRIFHVGENYLFHAAAWSRYYALLRQSAALIASGQSKKSDHPPSSDADLQRAASFVLLSALAIPVISTSRSRGAMVDFDEAKKNKNSRLTHLLGMSQAPTRAGLFRDALSKSLLRRARPEIRDLFNILEVDFHPLSICQKISPILVEIGADEEMEKYILPLQQVILTRLFQQLSQVYETVDIGFVQGLAQFPEPYQVSRDTIEKFIMNGNKKGDLAIRMDLATGVLSFDNDVFSSSKAAHGGGGVSTGSNEPELGTVQRLQSTPSEIVRSQLTRLAKALFTTCHYVDPDFAKARVDAREVALSRAREGTSKEHQDILTRKVIIQKRKDEASELQARREKERAKQKLLREQALQEAEDRRLAAEQLAREQQRLKAEIDKVKMEEMLKQIADLGGAQALDIDMNNLGSLDPNVIRQWKLAQLERERNILNEKMRVTGKRMDHLERAFRREEAKSLPEDYQQQTERDRANFEVMQEKVLREAEQKHRENVELKHRLSRLVHESDKFRASLHSRRHDEFEKRRRDAEHQLERQIADRKRELRAKALRDRREREERERELREAEEQAAITKEEQRLREEAAKADRQRQKDQRDQERQEALEKAALQTRREEEALARRRKTTTALPTSSASQSLASAAIVDLPSSGRPPVIIGAGKWRDREASKTSAGAGSGSGIGLDAVNKPQLLAPEGLPLRTSTPLQRDDSSDRLGDSAPPRLQLTSGNKSSWRDRQAAKLAAASVVTAPTGEASPRTT